MPVPKQAVTATLDVLQHPPVGTKGFADRGYVNLERIFLDDRTGPHAFHELIGRDQLTGLADEDLDDFERAAADRDRNPVHAQLPPREVDLHLAGSVDQL